MLIIDGFKSWAVFLQVNLAGFWELCLLLSHDASHFPTPKLLYKHADTKDVKDNSG